MYLCHCRIKLLGFLEQLWSSEKYSFMLMTMPCSSGPNDLLHLNFNPPPFAVMHYAPAIQRLTECLAVK